MATASLPLILASPAQAKNLFAPGSGRMYQRLVLIGLAPLADLPRRLSNRRDMIDATLMQ